MMPENGMSERVDRIEQQIDERFEQIDRRFNEIDRQFGEVATISLLDSRPGPKPRIATSRRRRPSKPRR
jgi:hypothetical protein